MSIKTTTFPPNDLAVVVRTLIVLYLLTVAGAASALTDFPFTLFQGTSSGGNYKEAERKW